MKLIVVGAGQVGRAVARDLAASHNITVVDQDPQRLDELRYSADVMTYEGDGSDIDVLMDARAAEANIIIACTDNDHVNILVCGIARLLSPKIFTIARVTETAFLKSWQHTKQAFSVDLMVGSNFLTAQSIVQIVFQELAREVEYFVDGKIEMAEFQVPRDSELAGKKVRDVDVDEGLRYAAVFERDQMEVARGDTRITGGSRLLVIGRSNAVQDFGERIATANGGKLRRVFILGGGEIAYQTALQMEKRGIAPKIIESDPVRAQILAKNLPKSFVLNQDATDKEFLKGAGIARAQVVISALRPDERNLFASLQAMHLGAERVVSVVHDKKHQSLFEAFGVEVTFNPRKQVIEQIIRHTRARRLQKVAFVEDHRGEVIEVELEQGSELIGRPLAQAVLGFPKEMVIGAVSRGEEIIIPTGKTVLEAGDSLVIFVDAEKVDAVVAKI